MITAKYFQEKEFNNCMPSCSMQDMQQSTLSKLDTAREIAGIPFVINSAYRSPVWEKSKRRTGTGSHTLGRAIDVRCTSDRNRFLIVNALIKAGFSRIGIANTYVHADDSPNHSEQVIWLY